MPHARALADDAGQRVIERLARRRLLVVTGKGGVGKTTTAVLLSRLLAGHGRRVLCLEIDPRENAHQMLDVPPSAGEISPVGRGLFLQNLSARAVLDQIVREHVRLGFIANRVLRSPIYEQFAGGCPGLEEMAVLGYAMRVVRGMEPAAEAIDTVVLDAPATGHGVTMLTAPLVVSGVIETGPLGQLAGELSEFVADASKCGVVVVSTAEEMPVQESIELLELLRARFGRGAELLVLNRLYPTGALDEAETDPARRLWKRRLDANRREEARLREVWRGDVLALPLLPFDNGPTLLAALATGARLHESDVSSC